MRCVRVVGGVHADRRRVVVDGDRHLAPQANLQPGAGSAATGEQVYHDGIVNFVQGQAELGLEVERGRLLH
ncbi:hypothetical protein FQZ97_1206630 [compost metagenome]